MTLVTLLEYARNNYIKKKREERTALDREMISAHTSGNAECLSKPRFTIFFVISP